ncbi:cation diffusion facilitator family transporter [Aerococcus kribbianus]|uniref:Cation diffusion facilitator family transporter n=1 Tax=Aerococcus kribbianus TaxID=2999064 RepID=A0A9X3FQP1_9LACT|nr:MULTISPECIES: cation diffusion facilitator family transporter [unclassified Aerococcus]MCZ0717974.1 cation diffusion facilitator family transporter [Aerococcus sp. YH-aer221]MCZ0726261.1 cation diffusion facilitator family transporter [Aerococcus sp. YH-aer222]
MSNQEELRWARRGTLLAILAYAVIAGAKLLFGHRLGSQALFADGLNNFSDTISSTVLLIGVQVAYRPADKNHQYGHRKFEAITTLMVSFIILYIGIQVSLNSIEDILTPSINQAPDPNTVWIAIGSALLMLAVYTFNNNIARKIKSSALKASAKDNLADALTSLLTAGAIFTSQFNLYWLDGLMALVIGLIIIKAGWEIFAESTFALSDGFSAADIDRYQTTINKVPGVLAIKDLRGRNYGPHVYLDVTILVDPNLSVRDGHDITIAVEKVLYMTHFIEMVDVHVEPYEKSHLPKENH